MHKAAYTHTQAGLSVFSVFKVMLHDFKMIFLVESGNDFLLSGPQGA